eukprot:766645-Hanusia_phi.AAC.5
MLDVSSKTWSVVVTVGAIPSPRYKMGMAVISNYIFVFGGYTPTSAASFRSKFGTIFVILALPSTLPTISVSRALPTSTSQFVPTTPVKPVQLSQCRLQAQLTCQDDTTRVRQRTRCVLPVLRTQFPCGRRRSVVLVSPDITMILLHRAAGPANRESIP